MIPYALKQVWFWLALSGLVSCWVTLMFVGRKFGGLWGRLYYCVFVTLLEVMFCLGLIWHMDPKRMPHIFCIAQVISFALGSYALTGLCASFALACATAVFNPSKVNSGRAVLAWHPRYIPLVIFFPGVACVAHITLLITLDAVQVSLSDDLHCDATDPIWMRLIGYAGLPLVVSIPFLVLSILTALRLYKMSRPSGTSGTMQSTERDEPDLSTHSFEGPNQKRRNHISMGAFLPYPTKARFQGSTAAHPATSPDKEEYPLHQHPFPPVDPATGKPYSPSLEDRDASSFTFTTASLKAANTHTQLLHDSRNHLRNPSPHERHMRSNSGTPDSAFSVTMPVFASNPLLPHTKALATVPSSGGSLQSRTAGASDTQIGVAITTGDSPRDSPHSEGVMFDDGETVGLAVTTDEPDRRTPTPTTRLRTPSPLRHAEGVSLALSDTQTVQDGPRSPEVSRAHPTTPDSGYGMASEDRTRSSESITRTLPSPDHPLGSLVRASQSAPHGLSSAGRTASQAPHQRQPSFVSSATFYSTPFPFSDREDRDLLPFSPASSVQSPKDMGIDLAPDRGHRAQDADDKNQDGSDIKELDWEDDEYDHHVEMPMRTVERRDPRERLGVYNPTPPTPTAIMLEQRRQKLQRKQVREVRVRARGLGKAIWRMILFQIAFFSVQLLASLSSVIDTARNSITPFGTQHVALILAAWGPLFIFVLPTKVLLFWRWRP